MSRPAEIVGQFEGEPPLVYADEHGNLLFLNNQNEFVEFSSPWDSSIEPYELNFHWMVPSRLRPGIVFLLSGEHIIEFDLEKSRKAPQMFNEAKVLVELPREFLFAIGVFTMNVYETEVLLLTKYGSSLTLISLEDHSSTPLRLKKTNGQKINCVQFDTSFSHQLQYSHSSEEAVKVNRIVWYSTPYSLVKCNYSTLESGKRKNKEKLICGGYGKSRSLLDGPLASASFSQIEFFLLSQDEQNTLVFVSEILYHVIRIVNLNEGTVKTIAGNFQEACRIGPTHLQCSLYAPSQLQWVGDDDLLVNCRGNTLMKLKNIGRIGPPGFQKFSLNRNVSNGNIEDHQMSLLQTYDHEFCQFLLNLLNENQVQVDFNKEEKGIFACKKQALVSTSNISSPLKSTIGSDFVVPYDFYFVWIKSSLNTDKENQLPKAASSSFTININDINNHPSSIVGMHQTLLWSRSVLYRKIITQIRKQCCASGESCTIVQPIFYSNQKEQLNQASILSQLIYHIYYSTPFVIEGFMAQNDFFSKLKQHQELKEPPAGNESNSSSYPLLLPTDVPQMGLCESMSTLFKNANSPSTPNLECAFSLSDINLVSNDGRKLYCHKLVLCHRSEYFCTMLGGSMIESRLKEIPMEASYEALHALMLWIYGRIISWESLSGIIVELLDLAGRCRELDLKIKLEDCICFNLDDENVDSFLQLSQSGLYPLLKESCIDYKRRMAFPLIKQLPIPNDCNANQLYITDYTIMKGKNPNSSTSRPLPTVQRPPIVKQSQLSASDLSTSSPSSSSHTSSPESSGISQAQKEQTVDLFPSTMLAPPDRSPSDNASSEEFSKRAAAIQGQQFNSTIHQTIKLITKSPKKPKTTKQASQEPIPTHLPQRPPPTKYADGETLLLIPATIRNNTISMFDASDEISWEQRLPPKAFRGIPRGAICIPSNSKPGHIYWIAYYRKESLYLNNDIVLYCSDVSQLTGDEQTYLMTRGAVSSYRILESFQPSILKVDFSDSQALLVDSKASNIILLKLTKGHKIEHPRQGFGSNNNPISNSHISPRSAPIAVSKTAPYESNQRLFTKILPGFIEWADFSYDKQKKDEILLSANFRLYSLTITQKPLQQAGQTRPYNIDEKILCGSHIGYLDGTATEAKFINLQCCCFHTTSDQRTYGFICDVGNNRIRMLDLQNSMVTTFAGGGFSGPMYLGLSIDSIFGIPAAMTFWKGNHLIFASSYGVFMIEHIVKYLDGLKSKQAGEEQPENSKMD